MFLYEDVSRETTLRGTVFEFPGVSDGYVQQTGHGPRRYPLRCIFSGAQHDLEATAFELALLEKGIGRLEHPLYGVVTCVPFGDITRRDDLKSEANQSIVEVTFWTTVVEVYPSARPAPQNEILAALGNFDVVAAQRFADATDLGSVLNKANEKATIRGFLQQVSDALTGVSDVVADINREFRTVQRDINFGLDVLVGQPLVLARQVRDLITLPARAYTGIRSRLDGYGRMAESIFGSDAGNPTTSLASGAALATRTDRIANDFHTSDFFVLTSVSGSILACTATPIDNDGLVAGPIFRTRPEALDAAATIQEQFEAAVEWRDTGLDALATIPGVHPYQVDTGEAYQALHAAYATTLGNLVRVSFDLVPERAVVLDRPRSIIDLCAELYGAVDTRLDFLIETNNLTGDEILELPRGRKIVYYDAAA
jgi:hypothetical protein